jgi:putative ABC transport system permease protein
MLAKKRLVTVVAVLSLGLGIGVNTAVFSVIKAAYYGTPPLYQDAHRLVTAWETPPQQPGERRSVSPPSYAAWAEELGIFESVGAVAYRPVSVRFESYPVRLMAQAATSSLLPTLGVHPLLGRNFTPEEQSPEASPVLILSYAIWQSRFGGDPEIIVMTIPIDSHDHTIVGVMPRGFWFSLGLNDLWVPLPA